MRMMQSQWLLVAKILLGAGLLTLVLWQANLPRIVELLARSDRLMFAAAILLLTIGVAINAHRWSKVTERIGWAVGLTQGLVGYFEAMFFNQVLPTSIGGDAARVFRAMDAGSMSGWAVVGVLIDRALGLWSVAFCLIAAWILSGSAITASTIFLVLASISILVLVGACLALPLGAALRADRLPSWMTAFVALVNAFYKTVISASVYQIALDLILTTLCSVGAFLLCARAVGVPLGWWDATIILQGVVLASMIPASIGGWGVREGAAVLLFAQLGINATTATAVSILFGLALTVIGLAGALVWMVFGYRRLARPHELSGNTEQAVPR
jgi:uncharacterized protein (TIRG00374 family)